jgi:hypothetical protein
MYSAALVAIYIPAFLSHPKLFILIFGGKEKQPKIIFLLFLSHYIKLVNFWRQKIVYFPRRDRD